MAIRSKMKEVVKTCACCNRNLVAERKNFLSINGSNPLFKDKLFPICRECINELINEPIEGYGNFMKILMGLNVPFKEDLFIEVDRYRTEYINRITRKKLQETFLDSDRLFNTKEAMLTEDTIDKLTPEELRDCQLYWGTDYTEDEYIFLISRYESYCKTYDVDSPTFESIVTQICQLELDIRKKRLKSSDTSKETKLILELMRNAGIAPSQEKESKTNANETFGNWVKIWENEKPVPEVLPEFKDVDNIEKYIRNSFLSPMLASLEADNPYEEEYQEEIDKYGISEEELLGYEGEK